MVYQPATGARDLLPLDVAQKRWIEDRLQQVFHRWGYHRIITSTLERMDTLMAGGAIQPRTVIQLQNSEDEELGLRPELTASIARTAVTRMAGAAYPQRLYYNANVFQRTRESKHNQPQEFYQAGVELLGGGGLLGNAEILLLAADCLQALDLSNWHLILGEAGITRSLLEAFPPNLRSSVRHCVAHLDRVTLDTLTLSDELHERARIMLDLRGSAADVFPKLASLTLDSSQQAAVNELKALVELLQSGRTFPIIIDLSLIQTIDYYTGIVFEVVTNTENNTTSIARGGRYDQLLGLYHPQQENIPGIGFVFLLDNLYQVLSVSQQLPQTTPAANWLVVAETEQAYTNAFAYSAKLRNSVHLVRVEMDLGRRNPEAIREYARDRNIGKIAWIKANADPIIESL
ncbi:ATP phosphoribosyltransferase regulatory subunit [Brunnivagina elsteri]|uniref:ATP phosphoribosyltransferase regulatory subunit n=1 Tax=Brunnivagina elsteri CCALA 953 TaxID=987040 RepID=A0A2A2TCR7_9CYAN|nr:ATP phosphoribosyltransferase regulatory subunit [Calothrix elsteri]PAX51219.1 ATP phosphoribosyltransferase regulatory subunit [Calothrix elsteri CCALA 953]